MELNNWLFPDLKEVLGTKEEFEKAQVKELSQREVEIMKEQNITMKDILHPGSEKCLECKQEPPVLGMWVCEKCYDKRPNKN